MFVGPGESMGRLEMAGSEEDDWPSEVVGLGELLCWLEVVEIEEDDGWSEAAGPGESLGRCMGDDSKMQSSKILPKRSNGEDGYGRKYNSNSARDAIA